MTSICLYASGNIKHVHAAYANQYAHRVNAAFGLHRHDRGVQVAMTTSVYSKQPEYMAPTPDIPILRHVRAPSILGNMRINSAKGKAGWSSSADTLARMDGSIPEYLVDMMSTSS